THARVMVMNLIAALKSDVPVLSWMGADTKKAALDKLEAFQIKIGYPDKWRDYSALTVDKGSYLANERRAIAFENARDLNKAGKRGDPRGCEEPPPTGTPLLRRTKKRVLFPRRHSAAAVLRSESGRCD